MCRRTRVDGRRGWFLSMLILAMASLGIQVQDASAQLLPFLGEPITTPELMEYADILEASAQQRLSMLDAHDDYLRRFEVFENRDVTKMRDDLIDMGMEFMGNGFQIPPRKDLEKLISDFQRLIERSRQVDSTLFDSLTSILSEDQLLNLDRVRRYREMAGYQELLSEMAEEINRGASVNLIPLVNRLEMSPEEAARVDTIMRGYEAAILNDTRKVFGLIVDATSEVLDAIDELGLRGMTPDELMVFGQDENNQMDLMGRFDEGSKPFQASAFDVSQRNLRTLRQLVDALEDRNAERIRHLYYQRAFRRSYNDEGDWRRYFRYAARFEAISASDRQQIQEQLIAFRAEEDSMIDAVIREVEESREYRQAMQFAGMQRDEGLDRRVENLQERRINLDTNAMAALASLVGSDLMAQIQEKTPVESDNQFSGKIVDRSANPQIEAARREARQSQWRGWQSYRELGSDEAFGPLAMTVPEVRSLMDALGSDESTGDIMMSIYDDYRERHNALRETPLVLVGEDEQLIKPTEHAAARRSRFEELRALDSAFFDDIGILVSGDEAAEALNRHKMNRDRAVVDVMSTALAFSWGMNESYIDIATIIDDAEVSDADRAAIAPVLGRHRQEALDLALERLEQSFEVDRRRIALERVNGQDGSRQSLRERMNDRQAEANRAVRRLSEEMKDANGRAIDDLVSAATPDGAWVIRIAYNRVAYPEVYAEQEVAEGYFDRALALPDLDNAQHDAVMQVRYDYRQQYFDMSDMIVAMREQRDFSQFEERGMPSREAIERELEMERIGFRRQESSSRALTRLRLLLTESQLRAIPELSR